MATKYRIEKAKVNKQLVGDEVTVSEIKNPNGGKGRKKAPKAPAWFASFVEQKFDPLVKRFDNLETRFDKLETRITNIVSINNLKE